MQTTIAQKDFCRAMTVASRCVEKRNTLPVLGAVRLVSGGGEARLSGTDLDVQIDVKIAADGEGHAAVMDAKKLARAIKKTGADKVSLSRGDGKLGIGCGDLQMSVDVLSADDWPELLDDGTTAFGCALGRDAMRALDRVSGAISTEETRYYLNGVLLCRAADSVYRFVATDGHRLYVHDVALEAEDAGLPANFIIPRKAVALLLGIAKDHSGDAIQFRAVRRRLANQPDGPKLDTDTPGAPIACFAVNGTSLRTKIIDGTFPDYQKVIPEQNPHRLTFGRDTFLDAAERLLSLMDNPSSGILFVCKDGNANLSSRFQSGMGGADIDLGYEGPKGDALRFGINGRYLVDVLRRFDPCALLTLAVADAASPIVVESPEDLTFRAVVMPLRV